MRIRTKLTLMFFGIVTIVLTCVSLSIYFFSADYREDDYYRRLKNKAENAAKILIEVDEIDSELLKRIEKINPSNLPNERITIYNFNNEKLYDSDTGDHVHVDEALLNRIRLEEEVRYIEGDYEVLGFLFEEKNDRFTIVAAATDSNGFRKLKNLQEILWIVFGTSLILVSILGWFYAGRALSPISTLVTEVDNISAARLDTRLHEGNGTDELAKLSQTFNKMLDRLEAAFLGQKNFIANASHELRTPITAIAGEIDVTLLQPRSTEKYIDVLHSINEEIVNLNNLSDQLLLMAQASTDNPGQKFSPLRIDEMLWQAKEEFEKAHPECEVAIELDIKLNDELLAVWGDEQLLKAAISNLLDNGCKYSENQRVEVNVRSGIGIVVVEFRNEGIGIDETDIQTVFDPFFRGRNARKIKGHGIGLSLVKRIVMLHKGHIRVSSVPHQTTQFELSIPLANQPTGQ